MGKSLFWAMKVPNPGSARDIDAYLAAGGGRGWRHIWDQHVRFAAVD
jgi:hypothetical protein